MSKISRQIFTTDSPIEFTTHNPPCIIPRNITHFTIHHGGKRIHKEEYARNSILECVEIPDTVLSMGSGVFFCCSNLKEVNLSSPITAIR